MKMVARKLIWLVFSGFALLEMGGSVASEDASKLKQCKSPAIYNFGDSNSDTGARSAALSWLPLPYGETFFRTPSGRCTDGRVIIDFIAEKLGLPYLSSYLDSIGANFRHGANFAAAGASILPGGYSPFNLGIQISQFMQFKSRSSKLYEQLSDNRTIPPCKDILPIPHEFLDALYTFDIGQNDLYYGFEHTTEAEIQASIPKILSKFSEAVRQLYEAGARTFWVHNTRPIGCLPHNVFYQSKMHDLDKNGCIESQNKVVEEFNRQLMNMISQLRAQLRLAAFTYVDVYSAIYTLTNSAKKLGFEDPLKFCCGSYYPYEIQCGKKAIVNGTVYGDPCHNPEKYISWDGIHYSEAANLFVAEVILNGSLSDPAVPIGEACHSSM